MGSSQQYNRSGPETESKAKLRGWAKWILKLLFTVSLIVVVATAVGWREIQLALLDVDMRLVGLSWLLGLASRCVDATQLSLIMRQVDLSIRTVQILVASSLSTLYGLILPGDLAASVAKWVYLCRATGERAGVFNAILYNRIVAFSPWMIGGGFALFLYNPWNDIAIPLMFTLTAGLVLAGWVLFYHPIHGPRIDGIAQALSHRMLPAWCDQRVDCVVQSLAPFRRFPWRFHLTILACSWLNMTLLFVAFATMALAVGIEAPWGLLVWVWSVIMVLRQLPISFHGIGVREATLVGLLGYFSVPEESAFTLGLLGFTHALLFALIGLAFRVFPLLWFTGFKHHSHQCGGPTAEARLLSNCNTRNQYTRHMHQIPD
ncbi:MAG: lysylphosphatidylglycerol synthase transmembrane domain-containing protein [Planctomycetota bacterium]